MFGIIQPHANFYRIPFADPMEYIFHIVESFKRCGQISLIQKTKFWSTWFSLNSQHDPAFQIIAISPKINCVGPKYWPNKVHKQLFNLFVDSFGLNLLNVVSWRLLCCVEFVLQILLNNPKHATKIECMHNKWVRCLLRSNI